ncbi:GNAT family N-acetyltransferase [Ulvibacterium sp.]|uniref:GNAT family N-acetyltransferase n=1 Tax=Ulvibacterium sp. TaxID=2665914 RepID=UPI00261C4B58|nr:GNAT family N-acetyltransferase [Ulvibacterium sp.]
METVIIREIQKGDNAEVARVVRKILVEMGVPKVGTAYADAALDRMYETYDRPRATYVVVEDQGRIIGCAGIAQLDNYDGNVCELQKMYLVGEARGRGLGARLMEVCLERAKDFGFEHCYLETMPYMTEAQKLYQRVGFEYIDAPMGDTGHYSCPVWMLKSIQ